MLSLVCEIRAQDRQNRKRTWSHGHRRRPQIKDTQRGIPGVNVCIWGGINQTDLCSRMQRQMEALHLVGTKAKVSSSIEMESESSNS